MKFDLTDIGDVIFWANASRQDKNKSIECIKGVIPGCKVERVYRFTEVCGSMLDSPMTVKKSSACGWRVVFGGVEVFSETSLKRLLKLVVVQAKKWEHEREFVTPQEESNIRNNGDIA